jgi:YfiH family protein
MKQFISDKNFLHKHFTTTKVAGDMKNKIVRNDFLLSLNLDPTKLVLADQIHGNNVKIVAISDANDRFICKCDGLISADKDVMLGIFTADCLPLLISVAKVGIKAAIHAGWRSICSGIIENTIAILKMHFFIKSEEISVYIGPHIRSCCYKVGHEMRNKFNVNIVNNNNLDLSAIVCDKLKNLGIIKIADANHCTFHENDLFFSYRYNHCTERVISVIV